MAQSKSQLSDAAVSPGDDSAVVGRPLKFATLAKLEKAIRAYFDSCDPHWVYEMDWVHKRDSSGSLAKDADGQNMWIRRKVRTKTDQQPYTMSGLARALGISRQTLKNYKQRDEFLDSIVAAKARCEEYWEGRLDSPHSRGASFNLNNNYDDWRDRQELTGKDGEDLGKGWADMVAQAAQVAKDAEADAPTS